MLKFFLNSYQQLNAFKRDWGVFCINIFDLTVMNWYGYTAPEKFIPIHNSSRPIESKIKNTIVKQFDTIWNLVEYLPEYLERNPEYLKEAFNNYNSPDYLLSIYQHHEFKEIDATQESITVQEQSILNSIFLWR